MKNGLKKCWKKIYNGWYELSFEGFTYRIVGKTGSYKIEKYFTNTTSPSFITELGEAKNLKNAGHLVDQHITKQRK